VLGVALYRAGRPGEAAKQFRKAIELRGAAAGAGDWLFLAMAEHRLGRPDGSWTNRPRGWSAI
jgi:hypothetical protein